jgi:hypothetical protein
VEDDIKPAQKSVHQSPEDTVIYLPAQQGSQNGANAPEYAATAATAPLFISVSHFRPDS